MSDERPETGPMQFGDDWPGIFIRGDTAFFYLKVCEALKASNPIAQKGLEGLKDLLELSQQRPDMEVTKLKPFKECTEE
jgi:hypothetical protein